MTTRLQPTSKFLTLNGLRLRTLEWGQPGALPVVCVHGYTGSAEAFNAPARHLQDRAHIIAMDVEAGSSRITGLVRSRPTDFASLDEAMEYRRETSPITAARPLEDQRETAL